MTIIHYTIHIKTKSLLYTQIIYLGYMCKNDRSAPYESMLKIYVMLFIIKLQ